LKRIREEEVVVVEVVLRPVVMVTRVRQLQRKMDRERKREIDRGWGRRERERSSLASM
jgi:hypothetical protein